MNFGHGIYLTPQTRPQTALKSAEALNHTNISGGLVYTENREVVRESIDNRFSVVPMDMNLPFEDRSESEFLFLGYCFRHYGHFILETLPMLSYCLDDSFSDIKKIFLPFFLNANNIAHNMGALRRPDLIKIINQFIALAGIDPKQIEFHTNNSILQSNFIVPPKAVNGDRHKTDIQPYQKVIDRIKLSLPNINISPNRNILVLRKPDDHRMPSIITDKVNDFATKNNIELIDMTLLSIADQISLIHETKTLIGFSGSGMHNAMFLQPNSRSVNISDFRDFKSPKCYAPNQKICNKISGCQEYFIDFKCENDMRRENFKPPNDKLTIEHQTFAAANIINSIETILSQ